MTNVTSINQYQNQLAFAMLESAGYNPISNGPKSTGLSVTSAENTDDVVMLRGDDIEVLGNGGDNTIVVGGDNSYIKTKTGNDVVAVYGNKATIKTSSGDDQVYMEGDENKLVMTGGDNLVQAFGDGNTIISGDGDNEVITIGDQVSIQLGKGNQYVGFWGQDAFISLDDGTKSSVMTMDHVLRSGRFSELEARWLQGLDYTNSSEKVNLYTERNYCASTIEEFNHLSAEDYEFVQNTDMTAEKDGHPQYVVATNEDGSSSVYVYSYTYKGNSYYYPRGHEGEQDYKRIINTTTELTAEYLAADDYDMIYSKNYIVSEEANANATIKFGNGDNVLKITNSNTEDNITFGTAINGHEVVVDSTYSFAEQSKQHFINTYVDNTKFFIEGDYTLEA